MVTVALERSKLKMAVEVERAKLPLQAWPAKGERAGRREGRRQGGQVTFSESNQIDF